jgi:hypothetical protein
MPQLSDRELAQMAREVAAIMEDWFSEEHPLASEEALALIIIALEQRGFLFGEDRRGDRNPLPDGENVIRFPGPAAAQVRLRH